jgi:hypothetical protein
MNVLIDGQGFAFSERALTPEFSVEFLRQFTPQEVERMLFVRWLVANGRMAY